MMNLIGTSDGGEISSISYSTANPYDTQLSITSQIKQKEDFDFSKSTKGDANPQERASLKKRLLRKWMSK